MALQRFTGSSAAKLSDLNPLIDAINALRVDVDALKVSVAANTSTISKAAVAVADLAATDEVSGWKQWKEQQHAQRKTS